MWPRKRTGDGIGRRVSPNFRISFRRDTLAEALWEYGEDALAEAALRLGEEDLRRVQRLAAWHYENDPDPAKGPRLTNARIMALAMIEDAEGTARDTKRTRRRTRPKDQAHDGAYRASVLSGDHLLSTPAESLHADD
jgi:hypothetical protein